MMPPYMLTDSVMPGLVFLLVASFICAWVCYYLINILGPGHDDEGDE